MKERDQLTELRSILKASKTGSIYPYRLFTRQER